MRSDDRHCRPGGEVGGPRAGKPAPRGQGRLPVMVAVVGLTLASAAMANPPRYPEARTRRQFSAGERDFLPLLRLAVKIGKVFEPDKDRYIGYIRVGELLLEQSRRLGFRQQRLPEGTSTEDVRAFYGEWAEAEGYEICMRRPGRDGETFAMIKDGEGGGLVYVEAEATEISVIWAKGHVRLGSLAAEWLGLPQPRAAEAGVQTEIYPAAGEPLPPLPLPDGARLEMEIRLTRDVIIPISREILRRTSDPEEGEFGIASLLGVGDEVLAEVRELRYMSLRVEPDRREEVVAAYRQWAEALEWEEVFYAEGDLLGKGEAKKAEEPIDPGEAAEAEKAAAGDERPTLADAESERTAPPADSRTKIPEEQPAAEPGETDEPEEEEEETTWGFARMDEHTGALILRAKGDQLMVARLDGAIDLAAALTAMFGTPEELEATAEALEEAVQEAEDEAATEEEDEAEANEGEADEGEAAP